MNHSLVEPSRAGLAGVEPDGPPDRDALAELVLEVLPRTMRRIRQVTRRASEGGLTVPQVRALLFVRRQPGTDLSALAVHLGVSRPSASAMVERLVRAGLVARSQDPAERRRLSLGLTAAGQEATARARLATRRWLADALAALPDADVVALAGTLPILDRVTEGACQP